MVSGFTSTALMEVSMDFTPAILDSTLGLNIAYPLKLGVLPQAVRELPLIWPGHRIRGFSLWDTPGRSVAVHL